MHNTAACVAHECCMQLACCGQCQKTGILLKPQLVPGHEAVVHSCQAFVNSDSPCKDPQGASIIRIVVLTKGI